MASLYLGITTTIDGGGGCPTPQVRRGVTATRNPHKEGTKIPRYSRGELLVARNPQHSPGHITASTTTITSFQKNPDLLSSVQLQIAKQH